MELPYLRGENKLMHSVGDLSARMIENAIDEALAVINKEYDSKIISKKIKPFEGHIDLGLMGLF